LSSEIKNLRVGVGLAVGIDDGNDNTLLFVLLPPDITFALAENNSYVNVM